MKEITIKDIIKITGGKLIQGNINMTSGKFAYDTREIVEGDTYIRVDNKKIEGEQYWQLAFKTGAKIAIIHKDLLDDNMLKQWPEKALITVDNPLLALQQIATYKRELYGKEFPLIAITGSVGKTSTKDMVANVVNQKYKTLKTKGNYNNHIGVPITILSLQDEEAAVIEMGMNHFNEIRELTKIAKPKFSIITNIGTSHIGNLGSRENILKAKLEILEGMDQKEIIINSDNDLLHNWLKQQKDNKIKIHTFGIENEADIIAENIELKENSSKFTCKIKDEKIQINVPVGGIHFIYNALCAALVGEILNIPLDKIKKGIETFELTKKRNEIIELKNGAKIINDAYNASPESMQVSIKNLENYKNNRKIAILGDMFELGEFSEQLHRKVGKQIAQSTIDILLCCGTNSKYIIEEAKKQKDKQKEIKYFETKEQIIEYIKQNIKKGDIILIKASNGMKFTEITDELKK